MTMVLKVFSTYYMHWNGYSGRSGGVCGRAAGDGTILLQCD